MGCVGSSEPVDFDGPVDFNHFEILRAIGKGAFGKVCIVKKRDTKQMYALKYMNKIQIVQKKAVDNVFREIHILRSLDHPFMVNLWFSFQDREDIFLVIDLMLGGDLSYHLEKEGRFPVPRVQLYLAELMLALDYLQNKRIIHRDLKPANMLLDSQGHIHLTDFNVACIMREGKLVTSMTGTKPYMAPEVVHSSRRGYTYNVDWWSLGVSIYEMLRGERPFAINHHMSPDDIYNMLTQTRPPASSKWDEPTCNILKMLLHPDSHKRLSSLEAAKPHAFFSSLSWDEILNMETSPQYVPSQNRIHCDPTHELEEMIVEPNPLHKKSSRLSKRYKEVDEELSQELEKFGDKFSPYNRIRQTLAKLESHEADGNREGESATAAAAAVLDREDSIPLAEVRIEVSSSLVVEQQLAKQRSEEQPIEDTRPNGGTIPSSGDPVPTEETGNSRLDKQPPRVEGEGSKEVEQPQPAEGGEEEEAAAVVVQTDNSVDSSSPEEEGQQSSSVQDNDEVSRTVD